MNVMLLIKYFSTIMQGKRKLCHTRFFFDALKIDTDRYTAMNVPSDKA